MIEKVWLFDFFALCPAVCGVFVAVFEVSTKRLHNREIHTIIGHAGQAVVVAYLALCVSWGILRAHSYYEMIRRVYE